MTDDLDKLAKEMRNMRPSKTARRKGREAAMAAFSAEFEAAESTAAQKNHQSSQGLTGGSRPTGQTTRAGRVQTLESQAMSKFNQIFSLKPQTMMMAGSCMAALMAALVVIPAIQPDLDVLTPTEPAAVKTEKIAEMEDTDKQQSESKVDFLQPTLPDKDRQPTPPEIKTQPIDVKEAEAQPSQGMLDEYKTVTQQKDNVALFAGQSGSTPEQSPPTSTKASISRITAQRNSQSSPQRTASSGGYVLEEVPAQYKTEQKTIVTKETSIEILQTPPEYGTVTDTVVVQPQSTEVVVIPPEYEWVDGDIDGSTVEYDSVPAQYETVQEVVVAQEASSELVTVPATYNSDGTIATPARTVERAIPNVTKTETRRVVKTPASTIERIVPYEKKDGKTRVPVAPAKVVERAVPAVTKQVTRRVIKTPARVVEKIVPAGSERTVSVRTELSPQKFYLRDEDGKIIREFGSRDEFEKYKLNQTTVVEETPVSTFSVDVDTASYTFLRASINRGQLPPPSAIRLEEMINYFPYDYEGPKTANEPFKANVSVTQTPWNADTKLMHIGIKGYVPPAIERPRSNIVMLIDTSGSMQPANKLPLLINSFKLLVNTLDADDTVSIVTYAGSAGTVLEPTPASDKAAINAALNRLRSGGSTAGAAGLELAYQKAAESFDKDGINRVILATDGDFNVGFSSPDEMKTFIENKRKSGIFLSVLGFGMGNYNDHLMQSLAQHGNGVAAGSALMTIAKDVKIQVEFNPATISEYRLIGYETRALKRQDFNNDKVDAGEINAGHRVTAIYELTPVGSPAQSIDKLRYVSDDTGGTLTGSDEFAFVKIRHKLPNADTSTLQTFPVGPSQEMDKGQASDDMRFAAAVAAVGQKLRGDLATQDYSYADAIELAAGAKGKDENGYRAEFIQMVRLIESLTP
jgi:Ca-activated chloride channel family protein